MINLYNKDCMEAMKDMLDNQYDLAIIDPPYAIQQLTGKTFSHGGGKLKNRALNLDNTKINQWDIAPSKEYFEELFRISKNQIIWGGNYFNLPKYRCVIVWDKKQPFPNFSAVEIAWSSFKKPAKLFSYRNNRSKIHPTQKPVKLYEWLLNNFAKEGDKILDTHLGSGSIAIACHNLGFYLDGFEIDKEYYNDALKRLNNHKSQIRLYE